MHLGRLAQSRFREGRGKLRRRASAPFGVRRPVRPASVSHLLPWTSVMAAINYIYVLSKLTDIHLLKNRFQNRAPFPAEGRFHVLVSPGVQRCARTPCAHCLPKHRLSALWIHINKLLLLSRQLHSRLGVHWNSPLGLER